MIVIGIIIIIVIITITTTVILSLLSLPLLPKNVSVAAETEVGLPHDVKLMIFRNFLIGLLPSGTRCDAPNQPLWLTCHAMFVYSFNLTLRYVFRVRELNFEPS